MSEKIECGVPGCPTCAEEAELAAKDKIPGATPIDPFDEVLSIPLSPGTVNMIAAIAQGGDWILKGGNYAGYQGKLGELDVKVIVKRKGFIPPAGTVEELARDRIYTAEGLNCALGTLGVNQIDGLPRSYMEFPVDVLMPKNDFDGVGVERHIVRWHYSTLKFGSHLPDMVARVELLTALFKMIKNSVAQIHDTEPLIVWRSPPTFEADTDLGITYLRCRLCIPGVTLPHCEVGMVGDSGVFWVEGL